MPSFDQEQDRLKRLRDRQLADRDPGVKKREFHRQSLARERRAYRPLTFKDAWMDLPHIWKGMFYGLVLGLIGLFTITSLWISPWAWVASLFLLVVFLVIGMVIGHGADVRDEIKDNLR